MKKELVLIAFSILVALGASAQAMSIDGDASDWAGKLVNLDATDRATYLDVVNFGCVVEGGYVYFAQTIEEDMVNEFTGTGEGIWANWWIDIDGSNSSGHAGWQLEAIGWAEFEDNGTYGTNEGIDIGVEVGFYEGGAAWDDEDANMYFTNGSDGPYQTCTENFAFSADGKFLECRVSVSALIAAALANEAADSTAYGAIDQVAMYDTDNWEVGARIDGKDLSLGITYPCGSKQSPWQNMEVTGHEGLIDVPVLTGDANLDQTVGLADLTALGGGWGSSDATWLVGDFNGDGEVGLADLTLLGANWGATASGDPVNATPEPATMSLLGLGGLALLRRKK